MKNVFFITGTIDETNLEGSGGVAKLIITIANALSQNSNLALRIFSSFAGERKPHYEISKLVNVIYTQKIFKHRPNSNLITKCFFWGFILFNYLFFFIPKLISKRPIVLVTCTPAATLVFLILRYFFDFKLLVWENVTFDSYKGIIGKIRTLLFPKADLIISPTEYDISIYQQMGCKVVLIRNPCIIESDNVKPKINQDSCLIILAAGRLVPQKGFDILLDIASTLKNISTNWKTIIVGNGTDETLLKEKKALLGLEKLVEFQPFTRSLNDYYRMASIFVLPSRYEGLPLVLIEAQALGIPCVAFDCPTGPREVISQGETGVLVEPGDINGFAEAVSELLQNSELRLKMSKNAIKESEKFSLDYIVKQWMLLFNDSQQN